MTSDLARWRAALMESLPAGHPVHDPTRAFTYDELEAFEREVEREVERRAGGLVLDLSPRATPVWRRAIVEQDDELEPAPTPPGPVYEDTDFA